MSRPVTRMELRKAVLEDGTIGLECPEVGLLSGAPERGTTLAPGMVAGTLHHLGRMVDLVVPEGAGGVVLSEAPKLLMAPMGYGDAVAVLDPEGAPAALAGATEAETALADGALAVLAGQSGRVWHRPSPDDPPFCGPGDVLKDGAALCLIEVMKTFSTVAYRAEGGLPPSARVLRWLVEDGGDVQAGQPLLAVEPA